jgi:hypothetical protein
MPIGCESAARGGWLLNICVESEFISFFQGIFCAIFHNRGYGASGEAGAFQPVEDRHG